MVDLARLLAERGVHVTLITTLINAARVRPIVQRSIESNHPVQIAELKLPSAQVGLPDDIVEAERTADAIILNTFEDLERQFIVLYEKELGKKVWIVGPLNFFSP
jgi:hypothetical protein